MRVFINWEVEARPVWSTGIRRSSADVQIAEVLGGNGLRDVKSTWRSATADGLSLVEDSF
jgi:hypothetical protein